MRKLILVLLIILMAAVAVAADTIHLRDGRTVQGTVLGFVNGRFAVRLTAPLNATTTTTSTSQAGAVQARLSGGIGDTIFIRSRDVERLEIDNRSLDDARFLTRSVQVELGPNWIDTGVDLRRGERVQVSATGAIFAGRTRITPGGLRSTDPNAPLPRAAEGVLIGVIGNDATAPIVEIGLNRDFVADRGGRLYLTANRSTYSDARGAFTAQVRRELNFGSRVAGNRRTDYDPDASNDDDDFFGVGTGDPAAVRTRVITGLPAASATREQVLDVPGTSRGTDTGIDVVNGDQLTITATGSITVGRRAGIVSADGGRVGLAGALLGSRPVPNVGVGALVGYIRLSNGQITQPFAVGSQQSLTAPASGRLFLLVNDDDYSDNSGSFSVRVNVSSSSSTSFPAESGAGSERTFDVAGNSNGVDTGIDFRAGDRVTVTADGVIYSRGTGAISPEGIARGNSVGSFPASDAPFGALVGYIRTRTGRSTAPFAIGRQRTFSIPAEGRLILVVNDDEYRDNSGGFRVRLSY